MLKIDVCRRAEATSLMVEGKLVGPWVAELERCWHAADAAEPATPLSVSLAAVTYIDRAGLDLLTRMRRDGVALVPRGVLMESIVREIEDAIGRQR